MTAPEVPPDNTCKHCGAPLDDHDWRKAANSSAVKPVCPERKRAAA